MARGHEAAPRGSSMQKTKRPLPPEFQVRLEQALRQYRWRRWVRNWIRFGVVAVVLTGVFTAILGSSLLPAWSDVVPYAIYAGSLALAAIVFLLAPMRKRATLRDIALYIDEAHPELENRIISAVDFADADAEGSASAAPAWMIEKFLAESKIALKQTSFSDLIDTGGSLRLLAPIAATLLACAGIIFLFQDRWMARPGERQVARVPAPAAAKFTVEPGDVRLKRGENQLVVVKSEATGRKVAIRWSAGGSGWNTASMTSGDAGSAAAGGAGESVHYHKFVNVRERVEYQIEYGSQKSRVYEIATWLPPEVESIDLTYRYPEYLGLAARTVPHGGNITAVEGTLVEVEARANKEIAKARLVMKSGREMRLERMGPERWGTKLRVVESDEYEVVLTDAEGEENAYRRQYTITAQRDDPPEIELRFPRGDDQVASLDEVPFDFTVRDDYGLVDYGVQYEIAGKDPVRVKLGGPGFAPLEAEGQWQMALEEMQVAPGDMVSWTVWAEDHKPDRYEYESTGDVYFFEVRPYSMLYREAVSNQGGMGGGGGQEQGEEVQARQKQIVVAIWNLRRGFGTEDAVRFHEKRKTILESELEIMGQLEAIGGMAEKKEPELEAILKELAFTVKGLRRAEPPAPGEDLSLAAAHALKAYQIMRSLRPNQTEVSQGSSGGGGGGGRQQSDLNELEMNRTRNFYENEKRTQQSEAASQKAMDELKELAERQKLVNEEIGKLISEMQQAKTEEEKNRIRRQLERLREHEREALERLDEIEKEIATGEMEPELRQDSLEALEQTREHMSQSLDRMNEEGLQQARSAGARALSALEEMEKRLGRLSKSAVAERMEQLAREMEALEAEEQAILEEVSKVRKDLAGPGLRQPEGLEDRKAAIHQQQGSLTKNFTNLMNDASDLSEEAARTQPLAGRKLGDWMRQSSREGVSESIDEGKNLVKYGLWEVAEEQEHETLEKLERIASDFAEVEQALVDDELDAMSKAIAQLRDILEELPAEAREGPGEGKPGQSAQGESGSASTGRAGATSPSSFDMNDFIETDYRQWLDGLRDAQSLLPGDSAQRTELERIARQIEQMRQGFRKHSVPPRFDLLLEAVGNPLRVTTDRLEAMLQQELKEREFVLTDEGQVPAPYRTKVADYFESLSESEGPRL